MSLTRFPSLAALHSDLTRLNACERVRDDRDARTRTRVVNGRDFTLIEYAGRSYWLDDPQRRVVAVLLEALGSANPEVDQRTLIRASGLSVARLEIVFARSKAWGELVIPGRRPAHFRLPDPPEVQGEAERRVVSDDE